MNEYRPADGRRFGLERIRVADFKFRHGIKPIDRSAGPGNFRFDLRDFTELLWDDRS